MTDNILAMNRDYHSDFMAVEAESGALLGRSGQRALFDRLDWLKQLHALCLPEKEPLILRSEHEDARGWLFLMKSGVGRYEALANWYNFLITFSPINI